MIYVFYGLFGAVGVGSVALIAAPFVSVLREKSEHKA